MVFAGDLVSVLFYVSLRLSVLVSVVASGRGLVWAVPSLHDFRPVLREKATIF